MFDVEKQEREAALNIATSRKVLFMTRMDTLKESRVDAHLSRLDQIEARLRCVIEKMGVDLNGYSVT